MLLLSLLLSLLLLVPLLLGTAIMCSLRRRNNHAWWGTNGVHIDRPLLAGPRPKISKRLHFQSCTRNFRTYRFSQAVWMCNTWSIFTIRISPFFTHHLHNSTHFHLPEQRNHRENGNKHYSKTMFIYHDFNWHSNCYSSPQYAQPIGQDIDL